MRLLDELKDNLSDNARHFVDFPEVIFFDDFHDHVEALHGTEIKKFEMDGILEMWLEFTFRENTFFVNNRMGDYWFFVNDPKCPDEILIEIADHFRKLLEKDETNIQELDANVM